MKIVAAVLALAGVAVAGTRTAAAQERAPSTPSVTTGPGGGAAPPDALPVLPKVTLVDAVKRALAKNPTAEVAEQEIRRSEALQEQARAGWLPTLNANATYTRLDADRVLNDRVIAAANQLNANLTANVPILAPRAWVFHARAKDIVLVAKASAEEAKRQVALSTGRAFLTVIAQHRVLDSAKRARDVARAHEEFAKSRLQGGIGNRLDAVRAAQERASSETRVRNQLIALARAQEALGVLVAEGGPLDATDETSLGDAPSLAGALAQAESRSDIVAQKERAETARKAVRDSYAEYLPILSATGQTFYQNPPTLTVPETGWQVQVLLTLPIFDGGTRYGLTHEREAASAQARSRLEGALRQARSEVRTAFEAIRQADEAVAQARDAAALAREALELSQLAYRSGATSNIEVVDAERRALDAETDAAVAEDAARQARLDLLVAAGRFP